MADYTVIGNVTFNSAEVLSSKKIDEKTTCMSGALWEVKTISGTYRFRDNNNLNKDALPAIFAGQIKNCNIESMNGTSEGGIRYSIYNSVIGNIDLNNEKKDAISVDKTSNVNFLELDDIDKVTVHEDNPNAIKQTAIYKYNWEY